MLIVQTPIMLMWTFPMSLPLLCLTTLRLCPLPVQFVDIVVEKSVLTMLLKLTSCSSSAITSRIKLGLLNIRSPAPKAVIVNEINTDNQLNMLCFTYTLVKQVDYLALNCKLLSQPTYQW